VFSLNQKRSVQLLKSRPAPSQQKLPSTIRYVTGARAQSGLARSGDQSSPGFSGPVTLATADGIRLQGDIAIPQEPGRHPAILLLVPGSIHGEDPTAKTNKARFDSLAAQGNVVLALTPRPSLPGAEETKSPLLGRFYLLSLRADLVGRMLLGMRVEDAIQGIDFLASSPSVDPQKIAADGSGHMGLVLLHAAVLDSRLTHVTVDRVLASYRGLLDAPLPVDIAEDIVPGVLLHYDVPDLIQFLGGRATVTDPLHEYKELPQ
jgi:cephalosporin-C deacetylase-like acetyl esterase